MPNFRLSRRRFASIRIYSEVAETPQLALENTSTRILWTPGLAQRMARLFSQRSFYVEKERKIVHEWMDKQWYMLAMKYTFLLTSEWIIKAVEFRKND